MAQTIKLKRSATQGASPTTSQLELGEVAINTYDGKMYIKKNVGGTESIVEIGSGGGLTSSFTLYEYTATASQTTFSGSDSNSNTLAYDTGTPPKILVYLNGVLLDHTTDYTATNGTSVVLTSGAAASDLLQVAAYKSESSVALDIDLADNVKLKFGDDDDLQIYHDGSHSYIDDAGTGGLYLRSDNFRVLKGDGSERMIQADDDGAVLLYYDGSAKIQTTNDGVTVTGDVEADEFIGDVRGAVLFKAQAGETLAKGEVVYISGISGNTTIVSKADADDASKMPAFGLVAVAASSGNPVDIYTNGILSDIDTSSYSEGDELFVSTTAGALTATPPTGESAALQKIGKVTRSNATSGSIFIVGAGRTNAVPNLDDGDIFIGNASNQAVTQSLTTAAQTAGALMDSEVTNLAQVKAFDSSDYATAAQGTTADSAMQDLVDDTTPQLGGNLDLNSNNITGTGNVNITGTVTSGNISVANITTSTASIFSDTPFAFLTTSTAAQNIRTKSVFAGTSYGDTPPAGSFNATNTYELNGVTIVDSSANLTNIGTISSGAITATKSSSHTTGTISHSNAALDLYNSLESDTDEKGSIITFTDNYYDGSNYIKTTRAAIKGGTDTTGNTANGFLAFYTDSNSANTANERMRIDFNGNFDFKSGNFSNVGTISSGAISTSGTINGSQNQNAGYIHKLTNTNTGTSAYTEFTVESGTQELRIGTSQNYSDGQWDGSWIYAAAGDLFLKSENAHVKMYAGGSVTPKWTFNTDGSIRQGDYNGSTFVDSSRNITAGTISSGNITTTGYLRGPSTFTIDPATHGDDTGTVVIAGNLQVDGTTTTINSTTLTVDDLNITLASGSANSAAANGAGITVDIANNTNPTLLYNGTLDTWEFNKRVDVTSEVRLFRSDGTRSGSILHNTSGTVVRTNSNGDNLYLQAAGTGNVYIQPTQAGYSTVINEDGIDSDFRVESDGNTHAFFVDAGNSRIGINTSGLTADGLVIGTNNNNCELDLHNTSTNGSRWRLNSSAQGHFTIENKTEATTDFSILDTSGNVGVGIASPVYRFHAYHPTTNVVARFESGDGQVWMDLHDSNSGTYGALLGHDGSAGQLFMVADQGVNRRFIIDTSGQVSIGTNVNPVARLQVEELGIDTTTTSTTATTQVAIDTFAAATFRSARYTIQVTNSTDSTYHLTEVLLIHDGTTPQITEYGTIFTGSAEATFDADISSGNVRLLATPATTDSMTFKVVRHCITV